MQRGTSFVVCLAFAATTFAACGTDEIVPDGGPPVVDAPTVDATDAQVVIDAMPVDAGADAPPMSCVVSPASVRIIEPHGLDVTVAVSLSSQPPGPASVAIASADPAVATVSPATVSFTTSDWSTAKLILIHAVSDDDLVSENTSVTCTPGEAGWMPATIAVEVLDETDVVLSVNTSTLPVAEGTSAMFAARLTAMPLAPLTVTVVSADVDTVTASPASFEIAPADWNVDHPVTVTAVEDADLLNEDVYVTLVTQGLSPRTITARVTDND